MDSFNAALNLANITDGRGNGLALAGAGEAYLSQAHARTSEGLYTAAAAALRRGCEMAGRFLQGIGDGVDCDGSVEEELFALKLLGDLHTYGHKLPPIVFEDMEGGAGGDGGGQGFGTKKAAATRLVRVFQKYCWL